MHETHLIQPIIKNISEHARKEGAKVVSKVRLKVGEYTGIREETFRETFFVLAKDTMLEKSELELTFFPGTGVEVISFDIE